MKEVGLTLRVHLTHANELRQTVDMTPDYFQRWFQRLNGCWTHKNEMFLVRDTEVAGKSASGWLEVIPTMDIEAAEDEAIAEGVEYGRRSAGRAVRRFAVHVYTEDEAWLSLNYSIA